MRYQYAGPGPHEEDGAVLRPGDVREFDAPPDGPWELLDPPPEPEPEAVPEPEAPADTPQEF